MSVNGNDDSTYRILGIDPGLNVTGYGVIDIQHNRIKLCEAGVVRGTRGAPLVDRVHQIHTGVNEVIESLHPNAMAIEELYSHYKRPRTAILMGHARGVICLAAAEHQIPVANYAATNIKKLITGNGRATKTQIQLSITRELQLATVPEPNDVADALAVALCHHYSKHFARY